MLYIYIPSNVRSSPKPRQVSSFVNRVNVGGSTNRIISSYVAVQVISGFVTVKLLFKFKLSGVECVYNKRAVVHSSTTSGKAMPCTIVQLSSSVSLGASSKFPN